MYTDIVLALKKKQFHEFLDVECWTSSNMHFLKITFRTLNLHNRRPKIFAVHTFGLKCCLHLYMP